MGRRLGWVLERHSVRRIGLFRECGNCCFSMAFGGSCGGNGRLDLRGICEQVIHCMTAGLSKAYSKLHGGFGLSLRAGLFYGLG
jgi:hypothetical protein